jgi:nitroreductase
MEFQEAVRRRRMVRSYDPDRIPEPGLVAGLLDLATRAPSAGFTQGWHFVVLDDSAARAAFWAATTDPGAVPDNWLLGMRSAPILVLALSDQNAYLDRYAEPDKGWLDRDPARWPVPYWDVDTGMAAMILLLAAVDQGLAGCFFGVPVSRLGDVRDAFGIPAGLNVVGVVSLGYAAPDRRSPSLRRGRKAVSSVVSRGHFGHPA